MADENPPEPGEEIHPEIAHRVPEFLPGRQTSREFGPAMHDHDGTNADAHEKADRYRDTGTAR